MEEIGNTQKMDPSSSSSGGESSEEDWLKTEISKIKTKNPSKRKMKITHHLHPKRVCHSGTVDVAYDHFDTSNSAMVKEVPAKILEAHKDHGKFINMKGIRATSSRENLVQLLRQKLLEHKWGDAALIMEGLAHDTRRSEYQFSDMFWKAGNEIIYSHPVSATDSEYALAHKQATRLNCLRTSPVHIFFEHIMYLIVQKDFQGAREALTYYRSAFKGRGLSGSFLRGEVEDWTPTLEGYLGLLDYITWKQMHSSENPAVLLFEEDQEKSSTVELAEKAISHFEEALRSPGIWDSFVTKHTEILETLGRAADAEESLRFYCLTNPNNPNAHKYLYQFLLQHSDSEENESARLEALSKLHYVAPADDLMVDLHELRLKTAFEASDHNAFIAMAGLSLEVIMAMLDHETHITNERAWLALKSGLTRVQKHLDNASSFEGVLNVAWYATKRQTWWPQYHFTTFQANKAVQFGSVLARAKSAVADVLIGKRSEFRQFVKSARKKRSKKKKEL